MDRTDLSFGLDSPPTEEDLRGVFSDRLFLELLYPQTIRPPSRANALRHWLTHPEKPGDCQLTVRHGETQQFLGCARVEHQELSYFIHNRFHGRGCGSLMLDWLIRNVLENAPQRTYLAIIDRSNVPSKQLIERAGFRFSGISRRDSSVRVLLRYSRNIGTQETEHPTDQAR